MNKRLIALLSSILFVSTVSNLYAAPLTQMLPQPKTSYVSIEVPLHKNDNYQITIQRIDFWEGYVIFVGQITATDHSECVSRLDFKLKLAHAIFDLKPRESWIRDAYGVPSPGTGWNDICVFGGESEVLVLPFVVSGRPDENVELYYEEKGVSFDQTLQSMWNVRVAASEVAIPLPTPVPAAAPAAIPQSVNIIVDMPHLLGMTVAQVENELGEAASVSSFAAGDVGPFEGSGTWRNYWVEQYEILASFNRDNVLQGIQITYGLDEEGYSLRDWSELLARVNLPNKQTADSSALASLRWDNLDGYWVWLIASSATGTPVGSIQVWLVDYAVAKPTEGTSAINIANGATVNAGANLRNGPGTDYAVIGSASAGEPVQIIARNEAGDWYQLASGAWIAAFLVDNAPADLPITQEISATASELPTATPMPSTATNSIGFGQAVATARANQAVP